MAIKVSYSVYHFVTPPRITEDEYHSLKQILSHDPSFDIRPSEIAKNKYNWFEKGSRYCLMGALIGIPLAMYASQGHYTQHNEGLQTIGLILSFPSLPFFFLCFLGGVTQSYFSYKEVYNKYKYFYNNRKDVVLRSSSFEEYNSMSS